MQIDLVFLCLLAPALSIALIALTDQMSRVYLEITAALQTPDLGVQPGERARQFTTMMAILLAGLALLMPAIIGFESRPNWATALTAYALAALAFGYFGYVVLYVLYLSFSDGTFQPNAIRLARDTLVSIAFNVTAAAVIFKLHGLNPPAGLMVGVWDYLYFSMVTFSTLGFGDFTPMPDTRLYAAFYALLGNFHLGVIVGTVLVALK